MCTTNALLQRFGAVHRVHYKRRDGSHPKNQLFGAVHRVLSGLHTWPQIGAGAAVGSADAALWLLWAQPRLERVLSGAQLIALATAFVVIGALTIGSVERWLARRGGLRAALGARPAD